MKKLLVSFLLLFSVGVVAQDFVTSSILIRTNFVSGQLYTNNYKRTIFVVTGVTNVVAAVAGTCTIDLQCFQQGGAAHTQGFTNGWGQGTTASTVAVTNKSTVSGYIPIGFVFTLTNQCVGAGNAAGPIGGQIFVPSN